MHIIKPTLFALGLCCVPWTAAHAQDAAVTPKTADANQVLLKATGPYEDMAHYAIARKDDQVIKFLAVADTSAGEIVKMLPADEAKEFEALRGKLHKAIEAKDRVATADCSVTIFRLLIDRCDGSTLVVPREVDLLDYAGYKLAVLAAAPNPDWTAIIKLADESEAWWKAVAPRVQDKHLRATMTSAIVGMKQAAAENNLSMLKYAAQMDLDLVDLLEDGFKVAKARLGGAASGGR